MPTTIPSAPADRHLERLEGLRPTMAKVLTNLENRRESVGLAVGRCFELAHLSQKEAAGLMDRDPAQIARWCAGSERPQFDVLLGVPVLARWLPVALAEAAGDGVEVTMTVTVRTA